MARASFKFKSTPAARLISRLAVSPYFSRFYGLIALVILFLTTILWSLLGAHLQQSNADQLVNSYLFENQDTMRGAQIPGAHTFLIKWPIFYLIKLFGFSSAAFITFTVIICLLTVLALAWLLYKIDKRHVSYWLYRKAQRLKRLRYE